MVLESYSFSVFHAKVSRETQSGLMISMHKYIATETMVLGLAPVTSFRGEINDEERSAVLIALGP